MLILFHSLLACSQVSEHKDKTLSPYFFVKSDDPEVDQLPLKETSAIVNIAGVIADVRITQVYKNEGNKPLEAIYVFPASTRAAVYYMKMTIGEREIIAIIQEREKARQNYEQAKREGKSASLLEQERPNVFQMNVANIMPGDIIKVEMSYTELLIPEGGIYEFVYPTVVGPRYSNQPDDIESDSDQWVANPYTREGEDPLYTFDILVNIVAGLPINYVRCTSHNVNINYNDPEFSAQNSAAITLKNPKGFEGNRDFILQYRLSGDKVESGLLLYEGKNENFFLAMIQPPTQIYENNIPPREYVFIVDVSGSMRGYPLNTSKQLLRNLIGNLRPVDKFNVILFAGSSQLLAEQSLPANAENIKKAINHIDNQQGGGGTELLPALRKALALKGTENYSRTFIIATDGYVTVEKEAFELIRNNLSNANFFPFGIGTSVNRHLIEGMAHVGMGEPFIISKPGEADAQAGKFRKFIQHPVLTNIKVNYNGFEVYDIEPLSIPDVLAERPVIIFGKWKGKPQGKIELSGKTGSAPYSYIIHVNEGKPAKENQAIKYLWARQKIRILDDFDNIDSYNKEHIQEITDLGLKYNLLTNYTSFIAIDSEIRNEEGNITSIKQPLPLPDGVSNYAVGGILPALRSYKKGKEMLNLAAVDRKSELYDIGAEEETEIPFQYAVIIDMPEFPGGMEELKKFIENHIKYPEKMPDSGISGIVFVQFTVDVDGTIKDIKVISGINPTLDKEAVRVILLTDKMWKPGKENGKPVPVEMIFPVKFSSK